MNDLSKGYTESEKIGAAKKQAENRTSTGDDKGQRPVVQTKSVKTDKGSFKFKG